MLNLVEFVVPPPPADGDGVCIICRDFAGGYRVCPTCATYWGSGRRPVPVEPMSLYSSSSGLRHSLAKYKAHGDPFQRLYAAAIRRLSGVFFAHHLARFHQTYGPVDGAIVVPSSRGRDPHPLHELLVKESMFVEGSTLLHPLAPASSPILRRQLNPAAFHVIDDVDGRHLFLIDDVYSSGASAQSAAAALTAAGAIVEFIVVIGRRLNPHVHPGIAALYSRQSEISGSDWIYAPTAKAA